MFTRIKDFIHKDNTKRIDMVEVAKYQQLPTLWLLGKTGAGKSSLIQAVTGMSSVEIGNGFAPCTMTAQEYDFPQEKPIMRFLDTRGLGEAHYDATADLAQIAKQGNALIVIMRIDEPEQSAVLHALQQIKKSKSIQQLLLVHTAVMLSPANDRQRQIQFNQQQLQGVWGDNFTAVSVDFNTPEHTVYNKDELLQGITKMLPIVGLFLDDKAHASVEVEHWKQCQKEVLWYCSSAAASDLVPALGLVSVPAIQAKMLHSLAKRYQLEFTTNIFSELLASLGGSFALQYSTRLGARQLVKLIPVYGQTIGAVTAASISFATSYGLARAAGYYFYHRQKGEAVSSEQMQAMYKNAFAQGKAASHYE